MRAEHLWNKARQVSGEALGCGALVPLETRELSLDGLAPFRLRQLISSVPRAGLHGPRQNPFLPWDQPLEVVRLASGHVVLLNKYPVQDQHMLLITDHWQPQNGWIRPEDWQGVETVAQDTGGLWFFNSDAVAGASQPHRHLQLLPRSPGQSSCPMAALLLAQLSQDSPRWGWSYRLCRRHGDQQHRDLKDLYLEQTSALGLGSPDQDSRPRYPYNLLFDDDWFMTIRRRREHGAGFSVNGLGFAGYLLCTERSDLNWLRQHGPWALLDSVAEHD